LSAIIDKEGVIGDKPILFVVLIKVSDVNDVPCSLNGGGVFIVVSFVVLDSSVLILII
jgi:hypothetical protein